MTDVMRQKYRELSLQEKRRMQDVKDLGAQLYDLVSELGSTRETALAKTKIEEAVMWAVKHITSYPAA